MATTSDITMPQALRRRTSAKKPSAIRSVLVGASRLESAARVRVLSVLLAQLRSRLQQTAQNQQQKQNQRRVGLKKIKIVKPTLAFIMIFLIVTAGIVDSIDLVKEMIAEIPYVGWIINGILGIIRLASLGVISFFVARKVEKISRSGEKLVTYGKELYRQAKAGFQRVAPLAYELDWTSRLPPSNPDSEFASLKQFVLYEGRIVLNQLLVQFFESLPLADLAPSQTTRLIKIYRDQQLEYRKAKAALATCQLLINKMGVQDKIELDYIAFYILLAQQMLSQAAQSLSAEQQEEFIAWLGAEAATRSVSQQQGAGTLAPLYAT